MAATIVENQSGLKGAVRTVVVFVAVGFACALSMGFTRQANGLSMLWVASGLLCGTLLTSPRERWVAYIAAALAANLVVRYSFGDPVYRVIAMGFASTLDAWLVAYTIERYAGSASDPRKLKLVAKLAIGSTLAACGLSALVVASALALFGADSFASVYGSWFIAHTLGMVIFATLTGVARVEGMRLLGVRGRRLELTLTIGLLAATCLAVFSQTSYPLLFLIHPALLLAVFRHRFSGFVFGILTIAAISIEATLTGHGPLMLGVHSTPAERTLMLQLFIASMCLLTLPVAVVLTDRLVLTRRITKSEQTYRMLAEYSRDLVVRMDAQGRRQYVSPAATEMLGWSNDEFRSARWDLVHPDDRAPLTDAIEKLYANGGVTTVIYRAQHKDGRYLWIEAHARLVPSLREGAPPDIIYSGRDITRRITAEQALERNERRLRAITDNMPAFVVHVDKAEKYTFVNAYTTNTLGNQAASMIGRSVRDVMGQAIYVELKPYMAAAMQGETVTFEIERDFQNRHQYYQSTYVPDVLPDGSICGFYGMTFDISQLKRAEGELSRLLRHDTLTGLANRFHFNERLELAIARSHRSFRPIALLFLDVDHFKQINDSLGHAAGDEVLCEFARRLKESVRQVDLAARLGGDEFVVLLEQIDTPEIAQSIARKLIEKLREGIFVNGSTMSLTTSIGIAFERPPVPGADKLMHKADNALYAAKAAGRNTYRLAE